MDKDFIIARAAEALTEFMTEGVGTGLKRYGNGHINDTFLTTFNVSGKEKKYILQRINSDIFTEPYKLMQNIGLVTRFIRKKASEVGIDDDRVTLTVVETKDGGFCHKDSFGNYWRVYAYIEDALCLDKVETKEEFYESAYAFGRFQNLLADFDASSLYDIIPDFHNTKKRYEALLNAVDTDICGRRKEVSEELAFIKGCGNIINGAKDALDNGLLPLRVTHNDTKLNNVMIDAKTKKGLCVIDLDTVMPGLSIFDFGDSIRFGANTAAEDEKDLSKVSLSLELFEAYTKGFLAGFGDNLTDKEKEMLPLGAETMTLECGIRFLTDYLSGDTYFKTSRVGHNLDRARCQLKLVKDMIAKEDDMKKIVMNA